MSIEYKDYMVVSEEPFMLKVIKPIGKGSVHLSLRGKYTSSTEACRAIDSFLVSQEQVDGKTTKPSRES